MHREMLYAVCTRCPFLRAFSKRADREPALTDCPACGAELVVQRGAERFQPTYVGRVAIDLHSALPLDGAAEADADRQHAADIR